MDILSAVILGIIQGLAEFLPISSSGHLALAHSFFGLLNPDEYAAFDVLLHFGTLIAVFVVYWRDIWLLIKGFFTMTGKVFHGKFKLAEYEESERFALFIIIATLPLVVIAVLGADDWVEALSAYPAIVGAILIFNGVVLLISDRLSTGTKTTGQIKPHNALIIGLCQMCAILPGLSRSGSTITGGLLQGFSRENAVKFSFILSIPAILGANILKVPDLISTGITGNELLVYGAGVLSAAVFGLLAIKLLIYISKKANFTYFAYYCFAAGTASVIYTFIK